MPLTGHSFTMILVPGPGQNKTSRIITYNFVDAGLLSVQPNTQYVFREASLYSRLLLNSLACISIHFYLRYQVTTYKHIWTADFSASPAGFLFLCKDLLLELSIIPSHHFQVHIYRQTYLLLLLTLQAESCINLQNISFPFNSQEYDGKFYSCCTEFQICQFPCPFIVESPSKTTVNNLMDTQDRAFEKKHQKLTQTSHCFLLKKIQAERQFRSLLHLCTFFF